MKIVLIALAFAVASPALAQTADPHAGHKASASSSVTPSHADHDADEKGCCADEQKDCCKGMERKGCCAEKAKVGAESHAGHHGH